MTSQGDGGAVRGVTAVMGIAAVAASPAAARGRPVARSSRAPVTAPIGPFTVNVASREDARQFYNQVYQASDGVADGWTGSIAGCNPGSVSPGFLAAALSRVNFFRAMAGEPGVTFNGTDAGTSADPNNAEAQAAALMESANNFLQHNPPPAPATACGTAQAIAGSSHSNLAEGSPARPRGCLGGRHRRSHPDGLPGRLPVVLGSGAPAEHARPVGQRDGLRGGPGDTRLPGQRGATGAHHDAAERPPGAVRLRGLAARRLRAL